MKLFLKRLVEQPFQAAVALEQSVILDLQEILLCQVIVALYKFGEVMINYYFSFIYYNLYLLSKHMHLQIAAVFKLYLVLHSFLLLLHQVLHEYQLLHLHFIQLLYLL